MRDEKTNSKRFFEKSNATESKWQMGMIARMNEQTKQNRTIENEKTVYDR